MIKAYLAGISTQYEGEEIEIRYSIFEDDKLLCNETVMSEYKKPAVVGLVAMITLLRKIKKYRDKELRIIVNDASLIEIIKGASATKNNDIIKMAIKMREELNKFKNYTIENVSGDYLELVKWDEILQR